MHACMQCCCCVAFLVLLREVRVPRGKEHGRHGVRHDVGGLVREELLDAHGSDGDGSAHLVPDLRFVCFRTVIYGEKSTENSQKKNRTVHLSGTEKFGLEEIRRGYGGGGIDAWLAVVCFIWGGSAGARYRGCLHTQQQQRYHCQRI